MSQRNFWICLLVITALGTALRLHRLDEPSVWADELFQIRDALHFEVSALQTGYIPTRLGLRATGHTIEEIDAVGYARWNALGIDEWDMRIGTALVACLSIPLLAWFSAAFLGLEAAALLGLLLALSTWHLEWSQNARFYTPMFLYYNGSLALYFGWVRQGSPWRLVGALLLALLAMRTKPTTLMLFGIIGVDLLGTLLRTRRLPVSPAQLAALCAGALACLTATRVWKFSGAPTTLLRFEERALGESPLRIVLGNAFQTGLPVLVFAALGLWLLLRSKESEKQRLGIFLAAAMAVPLISFGVLSTIYHAEVRYTFVNLYGWLALAAVGLGYVTRELWRHSGLIVAATPLALVALLAQLDAIVYYESGYGNRSRFREAFEYVAAHRKPEDRVYTVQPWVGNYYLGDPDVRDEKSFGDSDRSTAEWLVVESQKYERDRSRPHYLDGRATLLGVYPTRVPFPQTTVRVYRSSSDSRSSE